MSNLGGFALSLRGVTKVFGRGAAAVRAVNGVDLDVEPGTLQLLMGPSGGGKTTLLMIAGGLMRPTAGRVVIGGQDLQTLSDHKVSLLRRRMVGFVFQSFNLLSALSARENVEVVLDLAGVPSREAASRAARLLAALDVSARSAHKPAQLSGGEAQRVAIARALANEPSILFADEPTGNLDSQRGREVMELLRDIAKKEGRTVIVASHDLRLREVADRVLWMQDGRVRELRTVKDPVCGMALDEAAAPLRITRDGQDFFFCGPICRNTFLARYGAQSTDGAPSTPARQEAPSKPSTGGAK